MRISLLLALFLASLETMAKLLCWNRFQQSWAYIPTISYRTRPSRRMLQQTPSVVVPIAARNELSSQASCASNSRWFTTTPAPAKPVVPRKFVPTPFDYHHELTVRIESISNRGWGIARVQIANDDDRLWVVMVPHVIDGELVNVRIYRNYENYSEADLMGVLEKSPHRVEPKCSLAGVCGGCQYQHLSIPAQREWKTHQVHDVLCKQNIHGYSDTDLQPLPTMGTPEVFGYRNKITPHYSTPQVVDEDTYHFKGVGFHKSSSRTLVDVPECFIATPAINEKYHQVREVLFEQAQRGELNQRKKKKRKSPGATLLFRQADNDQETGEPVVVTDHNQYMTTTVKGLKFRYLAGNFFQNNDYVLPLMVDSVLDAATKETENGTKPSYLIDCYCGSGLFALSAASQFETCVGIELNHRAVKEATANAAANNISNCHFVSASAEAIFTSPAELDNLASEDFGHVQDFPRDQTVVVVDPPRKGCSEEFLEQLYAYSPQRIVYMSCGPATQARDAKGIVEVGGYDIVSIQPFDLFPQTKHIECLMIFEKKK